MGLSGSKDESSEKVKTFVDSKIAGKKVVVFSKAYCPYCSRAKKAINEHIPEILSENDLEIIEIEDRPDCQQIQNYLGELTGGKSVPRVFINAKFIGGGDETVAASQSGKLRELLSA